MMQPGVRHGTRGHSTNGRSLILSLLLLPLVWFVLLIGTVVEPRQPVGTLVVHASDDSNKPEPSSSPSIASSGEPIPREVVVRNGRLYAGEGWLEERDGITVVHFKGTPRQMGAQHALLLGQKAQVLGKAMIPTGQPQGPTDQNQQPSSQPPNDQALTYMQNYIIPTLLRQTPARYIDEMKGFMAAVGGGETDEAIIPLLLGNASQDLGLVFGVGGGACTAFAAWGSATTDGGLIHGRNLDYLGLRELGRMAVVAIYEPAGYYPFIAITYPGLFGVMQGMNIKGISISMTYSLAQPSHVSIDGVPFMLLLRRVLEEAATLDDAISIIKNTPRTVGLTILVSDGKIPAARVVEVAADRYVIREPAANVIWATNRYETPAMKEVQMPGWLASERRDRRLRTALSVESEGSLLPLDVQKAVGLLRDRLTDGSLVGRINNPGTIVSAIFTPGTLRMWAAVVSEGGTAADSRFHAFDLAAELGLPSRTPAPPSDVPARDATKSTEETAWQAVVEAAYSDEIGDLPRAEAFARQALAVFPQNEAALLILGRVLYKQGKDAEAAACLEQLVNLPTIYEPHNLLEAWYTLGVIAARRGQPGQAVAAFQAAWAVQLPEGDVAKGDLLQQKAAEALANYSK